jgi:hypothetical protein
VVLCISKEEPDNKDQVYGPLTGCSQKSLNWFSPLISGCHKLKNWFWPLTGGSPKLGSKGSVILKFFLKKCGTRCCVILEIFKKLEPKVL